MKTNFDVTKTVIVVLMLVIILLLVLPMMITPTESAECLAARDLVRTLPVRVMDGYDKAVYDDPSNINQQLFRVNEYEFQAIVSLLVQNAALADIDAYCK